MPKGSIPTLFCINTAYAQHAAVCIISLLENNPESHFEIVVVSTEPLGAAQEKLDRTVRAYDNCTLKVMQLGASSGMTLPVRALHYTVDTYTRLWVADFFPDHVDRVLYLDSDMVVVGNIGELWNSDLGDSAVLGAVTIPGSTRCAAYGIPERFGYFQSGVLLINLKRWRSDRIFDVLQDYVAHNAEKIVDADQDVLNACLYDRRLPLPSIWNVIAPFYFDFHPLGIPNSELQAVRRNARIIHFNGPSKPWSYLSRHPRRMDYWKYLMLTEWRDYTPGDKNLVNWGKRTFGPVVPQSVRAFLKKARSVAG
jgi:lipopolysaccharide biosynthesis glycosyltransferase